MKGLIIGAGIGGLSTAIALENQGISVEIFEAADEIKASGAGILVPPNAMAVLNEYGLASEIESHGIALNSLSIVSFKGNSISQTPTKYTYRRGTFRTIAIHRGTLQRILWSAQKNAVVKTGHRCISARNTESGAEALFGNGKAYQGQFIVGADGIHSEVRNSIFPNQRLRYSGQVCWRGIAKYRLSDKLNSQLTEIWGNGTRFGFVQISDQDVYWYATQRQKIPNSRKCPAQIAELLTIYSEYINPVTDIIESTNQELVIENDIYDLSPLSTWAKKAIILVGDAAHASTPNLGQGGAQAIEDSYSLATQINESTQLSAAFEGFLSARTKKVNKVVRQSWQIGQVTNISNPWLCSARNVLFAGLAPIVGTRQSQAIYTWP